MMKSPAATLPLTQEQATRLNGYLQAYRRYTLTQVTPSSERNSRQRVLQMLQARLIGEMDRQGALFDLAVTVEEMRSLKTMIADLLTFSTREPTSPQRNATLTDLAALKATLGWFEQLGHDARK
ncbi:MAG TPA: hypothetical protein VFV38_35410 [Ktedonobacteraceae bacterium]|nr:hypothetical protein [Ktedonobacteraceae bacterium]